MAQEIREFLVTVPAGTLQSAPVTTQIRFPSRIVTRVSWRVPPGPSGKMGWQLTSAGTPVIPIQQNTYVVTDNQADTWDLEGYLDSGNWAVTAYNTGVYPHTIYFTFQLNLPGTAVTPPGPSDGLGVGVVGTGGTVITPPPPPPLPPPVTVPDDQTVAAVTALIVAAVMTGG
jgi:hypothetical protein